MTVKPITSKKQWETFFDRCGSPSFHHSWEWGEFQASYGNPILRLGIFDTSKLCGICLVVKMRTKRGNFFLIPHGPIIANTTRDRLDYTVEKKNYSQIKKTLHTLTEELKRLAQEEGYWFIRVASPFQNNKRSAQVFAELHYRTSPTYVHAESMHVISLKDKTDDQLLDEMRKNMRYYIRKAEREKLTVVQSSDINSLNDFWNLYKVTFQREQFVPYSKKYLRLEFEAFAKNNNVTIFLGKTPSKFAEIHPSNYLAGSFIVFTKSTAFYHHGASIHTNVPIAYKLQWDAIREAKRRGCVYYNLHGIYIPKRTPRSWPGLSQFKRGFGGAQMDYLPTQDYVLSKKYAITYLADLYTNLKRGIYPLPLTK